VGVKMQARDFVGISLFSFFGVLLRIGFGIAFGTDLLEVNIFGTNIKETDINNALDNTPIYYDFFSNYFGSIFMGFLIQYTKERPMWKQKYVLVMTSLWFDSNSS
jgi:hypothetical protein